MNKFIFRIIMASLPLTGMNAISAATLEESKIMPEEREAFDPNPLTASGRRLPSLPPIPPFAKETVKSDFLEEIAAWLVRASQQNCGTLIAQLNTSIENIPATMPEGYRGEFTSQAEAKETQMQIKEMASDVEKAVGTILSRKEGEKMVNPLIKKFEEIFGQVEQLRKNCSNQTQLLQAQLSKEMNQIITYQNVKEAQQAKAPITSRFQRLKDKWTNRTKSNNPDTSDSNVSLALD